ncbi:MAG: non-hydrolyzing UDP-N-acetylglucosamine 2-epimerase [Bryobacteraceae bacterium]
MMRPKTVMTIFGTRPEAIKLAPVVLEMQQNGRGLVPFVCVTGQHRQMLHQVLDWFQITPDRDLQLMQKDQGLAEFAGRALISLNSILKEIKPDAVLVQGDTTTAMTASMAAFYSRIPIGHVEAGLRTRDLYNPFPEEMNRRITGTVANLHFAPTDGAATALLKEQVDPHTVFVVGNTVIDALRLTVARPVGLNLDLPLQGHRIILVTAHRRENFGAPFESICSALRDLADRNDEVQLVYPVHLNPNVKEAVMRHLSGHPRIHLIEPLRYEQFVHLMSRCDLILTDSGGIQEEATALGKPTLVMRSTTERPEAISAGTALLVGTDRDRIVSETERLLRDEDAYRSMASCQHPFGDGYAARRILDVLVNLLAR